MLLQSHIRDLDWLIGGIWYQNNTTCSKRIAKQDCTETDQSYDTKARRLRCL